MSASRHTVLWRAVMWGYWDVLAYEHDGLTAEAARAEAACAHRARELRAFLAGQGFGPAEEDAEIAAAVRAARLRFAADLAAEGAASDAEPALEEALPPPARRDWRARRGGGHAL